MDEERGLYLAGLVMGSDVPVDLHLSIPELWLAVQGLQLTASHPFLHEPLTSQCETLGRSLGALIVAVIPEAEELLELGWHRDNDVPADDDRIPW